MESLAIKLNNVADSYYFRLSSQLQRSVCFLIIYMVQLLINEKVYYCRQALGVFLAPALLAFVFFEGYRRTVG